MLFQTDSAERDRAMELETSDSSYPGNRQIPIDLFVSKKHPGITRGDLAFADSSGNIIYKISRQTPKSSPMDKKVLLDATGNPLLSIHRYAKGSWKCYKGNNNEDKDLVFKVQRTSNSLTRVDLEVLLFGERPEDSTSDLKVRGCPFQKSCTIYKDTALVAQTGLMYKLHQIYINKGKFRLTIFPGSIDHACIAALVVIFLNGRK